MNDLTEAGRQIVTDVAARHGVSQDAVLVLLRALVAGHGSQAQFNHPDLGGMGQWSMGGMTMIGDMFNNGLKARVDAMCGELSGALQRDTVFTAARPATASQSQSQSGSGGSLAAGSGSSFFVTAGNGPGTWWPDELGQASSTGSQNSLRYALFPQSHRLAIDVAGKVTVYDTLDHHISGFSQQQSGDQSLTFTSQNGLVRVWDLPVVSDKDDLPVAAEAPSKSAQAEGSEATPPESNEALRPRDHATIPTPHAQPATSTDGHSERDEDEIFRKIERLADLHMKEILSTEEFQTKKAELLARL